MHEIGRKGIVLYFEQFANSIFILILSVSVLSAAIFYFGFWDKKTAFSESVNENNLSEDFPQKQLVADWQMKEHREWFVAPDGKATDSGTLKSPLDLATALDAKAMRGRIKPGDVIWLGGGTYKGTFTSTIEGAHDLPIVVRGREGERAILDKSSASRESGALDVRGENVRFQDLEVTNSFVDRSRFDSDGELNPWRGSGINIYAANTKYINLVVHDNGHAFGLWNEDGGTEIYGCIIFNNGNNKKEHGIYAHNKTGTQNIADNIIFNGAGYGLHIYANSKKSSISGFNISGNAIFNNGALTLEDQVADQILVGGVDGVPAERISLRENYIYNNTESATAKNRGIRLGYEDENNGDAQIFNNYIVSKVPLKIRWWNSIKGGGNTIVSSGKDLELEIPNGKSVADYKLISHSFLNVKEERDLGNKIFIRPNKYESGRAHIVVYNWKNSEQISVDLSGILRPKERFEIVDVQNYFGEPILSGTYNGEMVRLPMNLTKTLLPVGDIERIPAHTANLFNVFVVRKK